MTCTTDHITADEIPGYATYVNDYHYSDQWGNQMVDLWITTKRKLVSGKIKPGQFRDILIEGIIEASDWRSDFEQAAAEVGADLDDEDLFDAYVELHRKEAFDLIPDSLHAEFCWAPGWDGRSLDDLLDNNSLQSDFRRCGYLENILPGNWLEVFLQLVNQSSAEMIKAGIARSAAKGNIFAAKCAEANFEVLNDPTRPSLLTGEQVINAIENAYGLSVPMFHCEVNVRALFELDPTSAWRMTTDRNKQVHLGLHDFVNGAGYMDSYAGEIIIPAEASGFAGANRLSYGINSVYGIVRSYFYTTPVTA